jgi:hypothetical protein
MSAAQPTRAASSFAFLRGAMSVEVVTKERV